MLKRLLNPARLVTGHPLELTLPVVVTAVLALGTTVAVAWAAGFDGVHTRLRHAEWWWLAPAAGAQAIAYVGYTIAYREVAQVDGGPRLTLRNVASLVTTGFGAFVALGGFALDVAALRSAVDEEREARVRVLGLGALEYAVLAPAACVAALVLLVEGMRTPSGGFTYPWAIAVPVGFAGAFAVGGFRDRFRRKRGWRQIAGEAIEAVQIVRRLAAPPFQHVLAFVGAAAYWAGDIFCLWAAVNAFGGRLGLAQLIIGYATGYALTRRTLPFAGAGAVEALLPFALLWVGEPLAAGVLAVFAYRIVNLWLPLIPALVAREQLQESDELQLAA